jgi:hydrogenase maturation protease
MRTLVAGIGNIFNSDDGFGVEVAQRLVTRPMPDGVRVEDFGIRGVHLALELLEGYDLLVLVDAMPLDEPPGTVAVVEPRPSDDHEAGPLDAHRMDPLAVLAMVTEMGGAIGRVLVVGCQPATVDEGIGLSAPVAAGVPTALRLVEEIIEERNVPCSVA